MVSYDDMTPEERDRFIYLVLSEDALKAIVLIARRRYGPDVTTDQIMRFAFKVAVNRMTPAHLKKKKEKKHPAANSKKSSSAG
jgi:hypothetical protein